MAKAANFDFIPATELNDILLSRDSDEDYDQGPFNDKFE
jgi:hypothetical protein